MDTLIQHYLFIPAKYKDCYLSFLLNEFSGNLIMVFAATRKEVQRLALMLRALGFSAIPLHGNINKKKKGVIFTQDSFFFPRTIDTSTEVGSFEQI